MRSASLPLFRRPSPQSAKRKTAKKCKIVVPKNAVSCIVSIVYQSCIHRVHQHVKVCCINCCLRLSVVKIHFLLVGIIMRICRGNCFNNECQLRMMLKIGLAFLHRANFIRVPIFRLQLNSRPAIFLART